MLQFVEAPYPCWLFTATSGDQLRVVPERGGLITGWQCNGEDRLYFDADRFADPRVRERARQSIGVASGGLPDGAARLCP
jgi:galactose mutarotase-like enzyme